MGKSKPGQSDSEESEDEFNFYSGLAKRYKKEKEVVFPSGVVKLVNEKDEKHPSSARKKSPVRVEQIDSSDEDIFNNDLNAENESKEGDFEEGDAIEKMHEVEKLEDVEQYIVHLSPEHSNPSVQERGSHSSASVQVVDDEEVEFEEDPLLCTPLNDSELNQTLDDDDAVVVKVRFIGQKVWRIELKRAEYFKCISNKLAESTGVEAGKISLYFNNQLLDHYDTLKTVPIKITDIIDATVSNEGTGAAAVTSENMLEFKVQTRNRNSQVIVSIRAEDPMSILMQKYADVTGNELSKLTFTFDGDNLEEDDTPISLDLEGGECIDVFIKE